MPIVIRELVIRARLEEESSSSPGNNNAESGGRASPGEPDIERIVALSVEKVMEIIERKKER